MRKRIWLRRAVIAAAALFVASAAFSHALQGTAARRYLIAHLESSFGRPVEVGRFDFSLLNGLQLEAQSVTVAEDPLFGNEYFLRAESLRAGLRWTALLAGRVEFGSVSLTRPSLNLVRDSQGRWNIGQWLPSAPGGEQAGRGGALRSSNSNSLSTPSGTSSRTFSSTPGGSLSPERLDEIDIDGGRINFKKGQDKAEFALVDVSGSAEQESPGRWRLDLEATPMRVGVELQDVGTLRLRGTIGGASARLQPAELNLTGRDVSLADALRLANHFDYGMRGTMDLDLNARVAPANAEPPGKASAGPAHWNVSGVARLQGIHGWRLPPRDSDPAANVEVKADWRLGEPQVTVSELVVETASSHLQGSGDVRWSDGLIPKLHIQTSTVGFADVAAFWSALRPGVAPDVNAQGTLSVDAQLSGWPLQLKQASIVSAGGVLTAPSLAGTLRIGPVNVSTLTLAIIKAPPSALAQGSGPLKAGGSASLVLAPTEISFVPAAEKEHGKVSSVEPPGHSANSFTIRGSIQPAGFVCGGQGLRAMRCPDSYQWPPSWRVEIDGATPRVQDWSAVAEVLGQAPLTESVPGLRIAGGISVSLRGVNDGGGGAAWQGAVDTHGIVATVPFLNQNLRLPQAHAEFSANAFILNLAAAQALGTTWRGTISRGAPGARWTFDLNADALDVADLDRWIGPRARSGLLAALGFTLNTDADAQRQVREAAVARLAARGRLRVGQIALASLLLDHFDGDIEVSGRDIVVHHGEAGFFGGTVNGSFESRLAADPVYRFQGRFERVDLARLAGAVPALSGRFAGTASASLGVAAHGVGRANLIASLAGEGQLEAHNAELRGVDFSSVSTAAEDDLNFAPFAFTSADGNFRITKGAVDAVHLVLADSSRRYEAEGRVDFLKRLAFQIRSLAPATKSADAAWPQSFVLGGTVDAPRLTVVTAPASSARVADEPASAAKR